MNTKTIGRRVLAAGLLAAALLGGSAISAQASAARIAGSDDVTILGDDGWDFGGKTWDKDAPGGGAPSEPGALRWVLTDGIPAPRVVGYVHFKNAKNTCASMQIIYSDSGGTPLGERTSD